MKFSRFFINIGNKQEIKAANLIGLINENTRERDIEIGKIEILRNFSFFEVDKNYEKLVLESFKNVEVGNTKLSVQLSEKPEGSDYPKKRFENENKFERQGNYEKSKKRGSKREKPKGQYSRRR